MPLKEIVITGSRGVIGSVLISGLSGFKITPLNLPDVDVRQYEQLLPYFKGKTTVIHLAKNRDRVEENSRSDLYNPDNSLMNGRARENYHQIEFQLQTRLMESIKSLWKLSEDIMRRGV